MFNQSIVRGALAALFTISLGTAAFAIEPQFGKIAISGDGIGVTRITVVSDGSGKWTKVKKEKLKYQALIDVRMKKGNVVAVYATGHAAGAPIGNANSVDKANGFYIGEYLDGPKTYKKVVNFNMSSSKLGIASITAVGACNALIDQGKSPYQDQQVTMSVPLSVQVKASRDFGPSYDQLTRSADGEAIAVVLCKAMKPPRAKSGSAEIDDGVGNAGPKRTTPLEVTKVQLGIKTGGGKACPQTATLTTWLFTNKPGKVQFIIRKAGGGKTKPITVNAVKGANGVFIATHKQAVQVHQSINTKYMVEDTKFGKISPWVPLKVTCLTSGGVTGN